MMAALGFMMVATVRAQTAYLHRHDGPLVAQPFTASAIRLGAAGVGCFVFTKMIQ